MEPSPENHHTIASKPNPFDCPGHVALQVRARFRTLNTFEVRVTNQD